MAIVNLFDEQMTESAAEDLITDLRRKLAEQQSMIERMRGIMLLAHGRICGMKHPTNIIPRMEALIEQPQPAEELAAQLSAAKQEGYEQGKKAGRDEVLRELSPLFLFLNGEDCLEGVWFGEEPTLRGRFWWRTLLPKVIPSAPEKGEK